MISHQERYVFWCPRGPWVLTDPNGDMNIVSSHQASVLFFFIWLVGLGLLCVWCPLLNGSFIVACGAVGPIDIQFWLEAGTIQASLDWFQSGSKNNTTAAVKQVLLALIPNNNTAEDRDTNGLWSVHTVQEICTAQGLQQKDLHLDIQRSQPGANF